MLARRLTAVANQSTCGRTLFRDNRFPAQATRAYGVDHEQNMYNWREKEADLYRSRLGDDLNQPKKILWHPTAAPKHNFSLDGISNWITDRRVETVKYAQRFIPERHQILGADLATAHFIVQRGGRVRFRRDDNWIVKPEKGQPSNLPSKFSPKYILEAVDVNGIDLYYEGLSNLCGLEKLKWLSLRGCENIDDWGLDKISAEYPQLEYFDISGCKSITERGLESLYRMPILKTLVVTNYHGSAAFELTCIMLEDCIPGLSCEIHTPAETEQPC